MQKLTITFIYGKDDTRKLKYRLTSDIPVGVMLEKLIGFQFIVDSSDPKTFQVMHNGKAIEDLSKTFEECEIIDGDEIFLIPTVFDPIPPLPEVDVPIKKDKVRSHEHSSHQGDDSSRSHSRHGSQRGGKGNYHHRNKNYSANHNKKADEAKPQEKTAPKVKETSPEGEKNSAPIPFKPHNKNFRRKFNKKPQDTKKIRP